MVEFKCKFNGVIVEVDDSDATEMRKHEKYEEVDPDVVIDYEKLYHEAEKKIEFFEAAKRQSKKRRAA